MGDDTRVRLIDDPDRQRAQSFGGVADDYDAARPSYPPEAVRWIVGAQPLEVVDVGAGTGKLTRVLLELGHAVTAVEPSGALRDKLAASLPAARALEGTAEAIPLADGSADAVVVGQAFHWFEVEPALAEMARVLRPGGHVGLIWNFRESSPNFMHALAAIAVRSQESRR